MDKILDLEIIEEYFENYDADKTDKILEKNPEFKEILANLFIDYNDKKVPKEHINSLIKDKNIKELIYFYLKSNNFEIITELDEPTPTGAIKTYIKEAEKFNSYFSKEQEKEQFTKLNELKKRNASSEEIKKQREYILSHYYKFIMNICHSLKRDDIPIDDLVQYGVESLLKIIDNFDLNRGNRFSTYIGKYLPFMIKRLLEDNEQSISVSNATCWQIYKLNKYKINYENVHGTEPSQAEIIEELKFSKKQLSYINSFINSKNLISLDAEINVDDSMVSIINAIKDERVDIEGDYLKEEEIRDFQNELRKKLDHKNLFILACMFNIGLREPLEFINKNRKMIVFSEYHDADYILNYLANYNIENIDLALNKVINFKDMDIFIINKSFKEVEIARILKTDHRIISNRYVKMQSTLKKELRKYI